MARTADSLLGLATFVGFVLYIGMLERLRAGLKEQRLRAEATWVVIPPAPP